MLKIDRNKGFFNNTKPSHDAASTANGFVLFVSEKKTKSVTVLKFKDVTFAISSLSYMNYF